MGLTNKNRQRLTSFPILAALIFIFHSVTVKADAFDIRNELILQLWLEGEPLQADVITYQRDGEFFISLTDLMSGLAFPINVDARSGQAGGWYVDEQREFLLDLSEGTLIRDNRRWNLNPESVVSFEDDLYIPLEKLEAWFPIKLEALPRDLALNVQPTEILPLQARLMRRAGRVRGKPSANRRPQLPLKETPYRWAGPHTTDIRLTTSSVRDDDESSSSQSANYSLLSRGELGKMTSTISLTGREDELTAGRLRLERELEDAPLNANYVEIGDASGGRGILLRGGPTQGSLDGRFLGESVDLRGDILPGWEVELYRNGVLLDFQIVGDDGQYEFLEVPLELGENLFEFVFLGPFGEERRAEERYFVGPDLLEMGEVSYELAAVQPEKTVLGLNDSAGSENPDSVRYLAAVNVGLGRHLTARGEVESVEEEGNRIENYDAGLNLALSAFQASTAYQFRATEQDAWNSSLRTRFGATRFFLGYSQFFDNGLEPAELGSDPNRWTGRLGISTRPWNVPVAFDVNHIERELSYSTDASLAASLVAGRNNRFSASFDYLQRENRLLGLEREEFWGGAFNLATTLRPWRFRAGVRYDIEPETEVTAIDGSASLRVDRDMTMNFEVRRSLANDVTNYRAGFNWQLDAVQISPRVSYDSDERMMGLVSVSTTLMPTPGKILPTFQRLSHAYSGQVHARVFVDDDGDGQFDPGETPLAGVRVDAVQAYRHSETDEDGNAYLRNLQHGRQTDIALDLATLPDLDMIPARPGYSVKPRAGSVSTVDLPIIKAMELEGRVEIDLGSEKVPAKRVVVGLFDAQGEEVSRQRTAFDGLFLFSGVRPGEYSLRLRDLADFRIIQSPGTLSVSSEGGLKQGLDFVLEKSEASSIAGGRRKLRSSISIIPTVDANPDSRNIMVNTVEEDSLILPSTVRDAEQKPTPEGGWTVQLGAFSEKSSAEAYWRRVSASQINLLEGFRARYGAANDLTRLMMSPGVTRERASDLCQSLSQRGVDCLIRELTPQQ